MKMRTGGRLLIWKQRYINEREREWEREREKDVCTDLRVHASPSQKRFPESWLEAQNPESCVWNFQAAEHELRSSADGGQTRRPDILVQPIKPRYKIALRPLLHIHLLFSSKGRKSVVLPLAWLKPLPSPQEERKPPLNCASFHYRWWMLVFLNVLISWRSVSINDWKQRIIRKELLPSAHEGFHRNKVCCHSLWRRRQRSFHE